MTASDSPRRQQLRPTYGAHHISVKIRTDEYEAVQAYADRLQLSFSGALRELIRSHPMVQLPPVTRKPRANS
jgi:hypothetical protein